jgi:replication-associated recombination protein RarA
MNNEPLWKRLRPARIADFIGNEEQLQQISNLRSGVVLFYGPIGCGKTCAARALASTALGETMPALGSKLAGEVLAFHVDAQSFNVEELPLPGTPLFWKRRIIILDEAQEFTNKEQNRIQTYVDSDGAGSGDSLICLCTSEPRRVKDSLQSRCTHRINLKPLAGNNRVIIAKRAWEASSQSGEPPRELFQELDRYGLETAPRALINAIDLIAQGNSVQAAVQSTMRTLF